jgi:hypothetical protein
VRMNSSHWVVTYVRFGSLADIGERICDVRFTPKSGHTQRRHQYVKSARSRRNG